MYLVSHREKRRRDETTPCLRACTNGPPRNARTLQCNVMQCRHIEGKVRKIVEDVGAGGKGRGEACVPMWLSSHCRQAGRWAERDRPCIASAASVVAISVASVLRMVTRFRASSCRCGRLNSDLYSYSIIVCLFRSFVRSFVVSRALLERCE